MKLLSLLEHTYLTGGFTTRSDYARTNAETIAQAACRGYLTIDTPRDGWGCVWRLTVSGHWRLDMDAATLDNACDLDEEEQRQAQQQSTFRKIEHESSDALLSKPMSWFEEIQAKYGINPPTDDRPPFVQYGGGYDTAPYHGR